MCECLIERGIVDTDTREARVGARRRMETALS
jgi:hypothetical protein